MASNLFNPNELAKVKLPKAIELTNSSEYTSVSILPCEFHQIPYLPEKLFLIPKQNLEISCKANGKDVTTYYKASEGIGVIFSGDEFYLYTAVINYLPEEGKDISYIQAYAMGKVSDGVMKVTHIYLDESQIPDGAKMNKMDYYTTCTFLVIFGLLALTGLIASLLGYYWHLITMMMCLSLAIPMYAEIRKVVYLTGWFD